MRNARTAVKRMARQCANDYWLTLCGYIQSVSEMGYIRGMNEGIKQATGIPVKKTAPLKSKTSETITDRKQQMDRWVEHYLELYSRETSVSQEALNAIPDLTVMEELDATPTTSELEKAINSLKSRKALGNDAIPPEVIKQEKSVLLEPLHELLCTELLFADDAAVVSHSEKHLQQLISKFTRACKEFGLTISIKKTNVMGQGVNSPPSIYIDNKALDVAENFTYLGTTITNNLFLNTELDRRIVKASAVMSRLNKRV
ncbi:hypothetical protein Pmani_001075 [Petrolisthes manimaculis]|uniref:Reverse transcriptase domain-containing protein n=1 Tax=Petrolisthes manimaculis TaxID=1843537 RepID=A0AAE1QKJ4_9EUCA|nr:hypothetical protein Pmani_001075 [Petrolisthes manimaculis]